MSIAVLLSACSDPGRAADTPSGGTTSGGTTSGGATGGTTSATGGSAGDPDDPAPTFSDSDRTQLALLSPAELPAPRADISNRYADDAAAAALGQKLFFETRFAGALADGDNDGSVHALGKKGDVGKVACAGCHLPESDFLDSRTLGKQISLGTGWGRRRAPSLLDVGQASVLMWDGRHDTLYNQPFGPIESPVEMNSSRLYVAKKVFELYKAEYEAIFGALPPLADSSRFPELSATQTGCQPSSSDIQPTCNGTFHGMPGDNAEFDGLSLADQDAVTRVIVNVGKALGAYERLLTCGPSRFDAWMHGQSDALSRSEQRGAQLFVGAGKCVSCHSGPFLSDQKFHNVGLMPSTVAVVFIDSGDQGAVTGLASALADPLNVRGEFSDGDDGRLPESVEPSMAGAFRTPTLRCAARRPTFMHTGQLISLREVVSFFDRGGDAFGYPGKNELEPLGLSQRELADLVAFLGALNGPGPKPELKIDPR